MSFLTGMIAALLAPLITTIGFHIWEYYWYTNSNNSSFALNLYKCSLASMMFLITITILSFTMYRNNSNHLLWSFTDKINTNIDIEQSEHIKKQIIGYLMLSSVIGIIIGDIMWLYALSILGSVRVIFMDALKPFCATIFGIVLLNESFRYEILIGIIITVIGILCISLDTNGNHSDQVSSETQTSDLAKAVTDNYTDNDVMPLSTSTSVVQIGGARLTDPEENPHHSSDYKNINTIDRLNGQTMEASHSTKSRSSNLLIGYVMSLSNVLLDTYGTVLTKEYGVTISIWEINFIRFGFAAMVLLFISILCICIKSCRKHCFSCYSNTVNVAQDTEPSNTDSRKVKSTVTIADKDTAEDVETLVMMTSLQNDCLTVSIDNNMTEENHVGISTKRSLNIVKDDENAKDTTIPWYVVPIFSKNMTISIWFYISVGVLFVTYISPTLYNYSLFELPSIALLLTLSSIGPFYAIPTSYIIQLYIYHKNKNVHNNDVCNANDKNEEHQRQRTKLPPKKPTIQAWFGAVMTIGGITLLAYSGN